MRLRLSKRFYAALMAAIASVSFTFSVQQAAAAEQLDASASSVSAAIASELKLTTPAKSTSSGSSSSSSDDYSSVADASTVSGSAWNASYGSHISAPAFRSLSSKAPSNFAAANGTGSSLVIATPVGDSVPTLGATEPTPGWIFSFDNGVETKYFYTEQDAYEFTVDAGKTGTIKFNNLLPELLVKGAFKMIGENFTIDTNGVDVTFAQAMSNYGTDFTVKDSSEGKNGKITALAPAAFKSLYVESGEMEIDTQIGVVNQLKIGGVGATLTVTEKATVILTQQVECYGGTINLDGTVDASNLSNSVARDIGVSFVDQYGNELDEDGKPFTSGFLAAGKWSLGKPGSDPQSKVNIGDNAKVVVALNEYDIQADPVTKLPVVILDKPDMTLWFQNGDSLLSAGDVFQSEGGRASLLLAGTQASPSVEANVDVQIREECVVYVAQNAEAQIHMNTEDGDLDGSIGNLYLMNGSTTYINSAPGASSQIGWATFVGQGVTLKCNDDPAMYALIEEEVTMNNLIVQPATTASVFANILPYYGYNDSIDHGIPFRTGTYTLDGQLTIEDGYTFDLRHRNLWPTWSPSVSYDPIKQESTLYFEETLARLTMGDEGSLILKEEASFKASTVTNDSLLTDDRRNMETKRSMTVSGEVTNPDIYDPKEWGEGGWNDELEAALPQVNGTMEITGGARLTALNEKVAAGVVNNYTTRNQNFLISGGTVTVTDELDEWGSPAENLSDTTVSNQLSGSSVINAKAESNGSLTLDNTNAPDVDLNLVYAKEGDIIITHKDEVTADTVQIGAGRMVSVENLDQATKLNVSSLLLAEGSEGSYSKINAELHLSPNATLNVAAADGVGGIDMMGNEVVFDIVYESTALTLSPGDYSQAWAMEKGGKYDLFHNVSAFGMFYESYAMTDPIPEDIAMDASIFFSNLEEGCFLLCYSGAGEAGGHGENVGTIYLYSMVPEPTTGTLSLLALAALAARRRRKG